MRIKKEDKKDTPLIPLVKVIPMEILFPKFGFELGKLKEEEEIELTRE
jgi:hypothetical protein